MIPGQVVTVEGEIEINAGRERITLAVDDDEFLETVPLPLEEALRRVESGAIQDGKTITALLLAARRLGR